MSEDKIVLMVKGMSHVPSFKNNKMLTRGKLITDPVKQKWMDRCIRSFESQLRSLCQTSDGAMLMGRSLPYLMHWSNRFDDSVQWIPEITIKVETVKKGQEGAIIIIEEI